MEQQKNKKLNIALLVPNKDVYSETFIKAHRDNIDGNIFYYYGGTVPTVLDGLENLGISEVSENSLKNLEKSLVENNIDVVFAEFGFTAADSLLAIKNANIPLVVNFHGCDASVNEIVEGYKNKYQDVFNYASVVIAVSKVMKNKLIELGCDCNKIDYIPYGPHDSFFDLMPKYQKIELLTVGRFVDKKAPQYTILAFKDIVKEFPDVILKMGADGPLLDVCKKLVRYYDLENNVKFLGVLSREEIQKEMERSIAFMQHSITAFNGDMEGTPVAILEAGAASLPVIATRHAGIVDVVIEDETGLLVDEYDLKGMTECMKKILIDLDYAKKMGEKARKRIKDNFTLDISMNKINKSIMQANNDANLRLKREIVRMSFENNQQKNDIIIQKNQEISEMNDLLKQKESVINQKNQFISTLQNSKSFQLGDLFFRSVKKPYKLITFPINFIRTLFK